jgi:hypothetical protein
LVDEGGALVGERLGVRARYITGASLAIDGGVYSGLW